MPVIETPIQSSIILEYIHSGKWGDLPILQQYPGYEKCFVALHPFVIIKPEYSKASYPLPTKNELVKKYDKLTWTSFLKMSNVSSYKALDDCLAFYHSGRQFCDKYEFEKLIKISEKESSKIVLPQVDSLPGIIEDNLLTFFLKKQYQNLYVYSDIEDEKPLYSIDELFSQEINDIHCVRIETPDKKTLVVEDFDERFTYFFGEEQTIKDLIFDLDLEGFYCDEFTTASWSYDIIDDTLKYAKK